MTASHPANVQEMDSMDSSHEYSRNRALSVSVGRSPSYSDSRNRRARAKLGTNNYNWRYSPATSLLVLCSLVMLFTITNALLIPIESPNSTDTGNANPEIDLNGPSNTGNIPQPAGNQISGWLSFMAVISLMILGFLVYLSTKKSRGPHIILGIAFVAIFWIHWTVFRDDDDIFMFPM